MMAQQRLSEDANLLPKAEEYKRDVGLPPRVNFSFLIRVVVFPALGGLLYGFDIGVTSYCVSELESGGGGVAWGTAVANSSVLRGAVASAGVLGAFACSFVIFAAAERIGRRGEMLRAAACFAAGTGLTAAAGEVDDVAGGLATFVAGRFVYGCGCALATHAAPAYIAEMAPAAYRGTCVASKEALIVTGMLVGYAAGYLTKDRPLGWRDAYLCALPIAAVYAAGVAALPRSGRWLVLRGRTREASAAYARVYTKPDDARRVLADILADVAADDDAGVDELSLADAARASPATRNALRAALGVVVLQQVTGQPSVLYYSSSIFEAAGASSWAPLAVAAVKLGATLYSCATVEQRGRRQLLHVGISLMTVSLVVLAAAFALGTESSARRLQGANEGGNGSGEHPSVHHETTATSTASSYDLAELGALGAMFGFVSGYQIGFGPIAWLLLSELFGNRIRGRALAVGVQLNFGANLLVSLAFPSLLSVAGGTVTFTVFAGLSAYAAYFVRTYVPETRGLTLEQVQKLLEGSSLFWGSGDDDQVIDIDEIDRCQDQGLFDPPIAEITFEPDADLAP